MHLHIEPDAAALARHAARFVADILLSRPEAVLALPTGHTPVGLYQELVRMHRNEKLDFSRSRIFSLDEYFRVPPTNKRGFHYYLSRHLLWRVNVLPDNVHLMPSEADEVECGKYEAEIRRAGGIDLLIAGVGTNGHIAFNEPGSALNSRTRIVELSESTLANVRSEFSGNEVPTHAVTMGLGTILEARKILVLATGQTKQRALTALLKGPVSTEVPISVVRLHADATVMTDQEAMPQESA